MNTANLTNDEIVQYLRECVETDDFESFRCAMMDLVYQTQSGVQYLNRVEAEMVRDDGVTKEQYDRLHEFRHELLGVMDAEIDELKAELRRVTS